MNVKWLIEDWDEDNNYQRLVDEVKRQGYDYEHITYHPMESGNYDRFSSDECVVVQASLNLAGQLMRDKKWVPGPWLNLKQYECIYYYAHLGEYLFNDNYIILPRDEFKRTHKKWFSNLGVEGYLFIRPSSGFKTFTGKLFNEKHFEKDWEWVEEFTDPESLVIITTPKDIKAEWRFVAAEGKIIAGSMYRLNGASKYKREWPDKAIDLATSVAKKFRPDPVYCVDICQGADDECYLLEIGSFSCAGIYSCDVEPIVKAVSELALQEWESLQL